MGSYLSTSKNADDDSDISSCTKSIDDKMYSLMFMPPEVNEYTRDRMAESGILKSIYDIKEFNTISFSQYRSRNDNPKWIVFSHGNATDIFGAHEYAQRLHRTLNINCIFYDYPGYGLSIGNPNEKSCTSALESIILYLTNEMSVKRENITLIGQSIGTGIVVSYAHKHKWTNPIMLISPYKSIVRIVANTSYSLTQYIDKFPTLKYVTEMDCPIKIFHGTDDRVIGVDHGKEIAGAMKNKTMNPVWLNNIGHNDILGVITESDYLEVVNFGDRV